jgi:hypothetical protein
MNPMRSLYPLRVQSASTHDFGLDPAEQPMQRTAPVKLERRRSTGCSMDAEGMGEE